NPKPQITWLRDGQELNDSADYRVSSGGSVLEIFKATLSHTGRYTCLATNSIGGKSINYDLSVLGGRGLQILNVQEEDAGRYSCVVTNIAGEAVKDYELKVFIPPLIAKGDQTAGGFRATEVKTKVNTTLTLTCETWATPAPALRWYKDGQLLAGTEHLQIRAEGHVLQIKHTRVSDTGVYTCVATNVAGEDEKDFHVNIQGSHILQIPRVRAKDAGRYTCQAVNEVGEDQLHYELVVLIPPVIHTQSGEFGEELVSIANSTVRLHCEAEGKPPPAVSWLRDGLPIVTDVRHQLLDNGSILQIHAVQVSDTAGYICLAENPAGTTEKLLNLRVQVPPIVLGPTPENVSAVMNNPIWLTCESRAVPAADIMWYKDGQLFQSSPDVLILPGGHILHIPRAKTQHNGKYVCIVTNAAGRDEKDIYLHVYSEHQYHYTSAGEYVCIRTSP
ncbi:hypothetical protein scyTo_0013159, partial [Scyliorhinus torazame]|nr:hypothetical protein [Scyliorhinus torazame]